MQGDNGEKWSLAILYVGLVHSLPTEGVGGGGTPIHHRVIKVMLGKHYGSSHKIIRFLSSSTISDQSDWSQGHLTGGYNC